MLFFLIFSFVFITPIVMLIVKDAKLKKEKIKNASNQESNVEDRIALLENQVYELKMQQYDYFSRISNEIMQQMNDKIDEMDNKYNPLDADLKTIMSRIDLYKTTHDDLKDMLGKSESLKSQFDFSINKAKRIQKQLEEQRYQIELEFTNFTEEIKTMKYEMIKPVKAENESAQKVSLSKKYVERKDTPFESLPLEYKSALHKAKFWISEQHSSKTSALETLKNYEKFNEEVAKFAVENLEKYYDDIKSRSESLRLLKKG